MADYYSDKLSAEWLKRVYEIAPPRVQQYFEAEVNHVMEKLHTGDLVLDLGCGYGRIIPLLAGRAKTVVGIDTSLASLLMGQEMFFGISNYHLLQ
jgi:cyclopropane fatty-acyl-phospholipid synthase-like methyltransferase